MLFSDGKCNPSCGHSPPIPSYLLPTIQTGKIKQGALSSFHIYPFIPMSPSPSMSRSRSLVVFAFFDVPLPPPARPRRPLPAGPEEDTLSGTETGVAAPEGLALTSSK
jgi:hypothetical protein